MCVCVCVVDESLRKCAHAMALCMKTSLKEKVEKFVCEIYKVLLLKHVPRHRTLCALHLSRDVAQADALFA